MGSCVYESRQGNTRRGGVEFGEQKLLTAGRETKCTKPLCGCLWLMFDLRRLYVALRVGRGKVVVVVGPSTKEDAGKECDFNGSTWDTPAPRHLRRLHQLRSHNYAATHYIQAYRLKRVRWTRYSIHLLTLHLFYSTDTWASAAYQEPQVPGNGRMTWETSAGDGEKTAARPRLERPECLVEALVCLRRSEPGIPPCMRHFM